MRGNYRYDSGSNRGTRDDSGNSRGTRGDCVNDPREVSCDAFYSYDRNSCAGEHLKRRFASYTIVIKEELHNFNGLIIYLSLLFQRH